MLKKLLTILLFALPVIVSAAPDYRLERSLLPESDDRYYLGSTSPALRWKAIILGTGTSTAANGFNITGGCFAINGTCMGSGSITGTGTAGMLTSWNTDTAITATSTPTATAYIATSSTATSTFAGAISIGSTTPGTINAISPKLIVDGNASGRTGISVANLGAGATAGIDLRDSGLLTTDSVLVGPSTNLQVNGNLTLGGVIRINTGSFNATAGTLQAPAHGFSGDTTTGINNPAAQELSFVSGLRERARFTAMGFFGLGTTSPFASISIHSNASDTPPTTLFAVGSSTQTSTTTLFSISNTGSTTAVNGFNITGGCFAINNVCVGGGSGSQTPWTQNIDGAGFNLTNVNIASSTTLVVSTPPTVNSIFMPNVLSWSTSTNEVIVNTGDIQIGENRSYRMGQMGFQSGGDGTNIIQFDDTGNGTSLGINMSSLTGVRTLTFMDMSGTVCLVGQVCDGAGSDPFTHPATGQSATTSLMLFDGNASTTGLSALRAWFGATATSTFASDGQLNSQNIVVANGKTIQFTGYSASPQLYAGDSTTGIHFDGPGITSVHGTGRQESILTSTNRWGFGATSSPFAKFSIHTYAVETNKTLFAIGSSTATATTTLFSISNTGSTTASNGFNITAGCFAVNDVCLGNGQIISGTGTVGQVAYFTTTSSLTSVATSSIANGVGITVTNGSSAFVIGSQPTINCNTATASVFGCLLASDFANFFGKVATSTNETAGQIPYWTTTNGTPAKLGQIATGTVSSSGGITTTASRYVLNGALSIACDVASALIPGCLSVANWNTFNNKIGTSTSETAGYIPFASTNSATPALLSFDSNFFWDNTNKELGISTTSPWGKLAIVGGASFLTKDPIFHVSTSSTPNLFSSMFSIFATSSVQTGAILATSTTDGNGARIAIGDYRQYGFEVPLDELWVKDGRINTGDMQYSTCIPGGTLTSSVDSANVCGAEWYYANDASGTFDTGITTGSGLPYIQLANKTNGVGNSGNGIFNQPANWMQMATNTPTIETILSVNGAATGTSYYFGFVNTSPTGSSFETTPTNGCYLSASSTRANWALVNVSNSTYLIRDTGIASTTKTGAYSTLQYLRVQGDSATCTGYIKNAADATLTKVEVRAQQTRTPLVPALYYGFTTAGTANTSGIRYSYIRNWFRLPLANWQY